MDATRFGQIAKELPKLLDRQVQAILGRKFNDLTKEERAAYEGRRRTILVLRAELEELRKAR
ncbi:MAG: hypothetical protein WAU58_08070 [Terriglobales bacterium]|jgi:hypothetical protein